jgi:D-arabinose 1-dehydrogenase-like Zn-dependent alcohol dehydrogenase
LPCGVGVPYHAFVKRTKLSPADTVIIIGIGGVGLQAVQMAKLCGAAVIAVDIDDTKLAYAEKSGADYLINVHSDDFGMKLKAIGNTTVIFDTSGHNPTIVKCSLALEKGSKIILAGYGHEKKLNMALEDIVRREYEIIGSNGVCAEDVKDMMALMSRGKITPYVTTMPLEYLNEGCDKIKANQVIGRLVMIPE